MTLTRRTNIFILLLFLNQLFWSFFWSPIANFLKIDILPQSICTELLLFILPAVIYFFITRESPKKILHLKPLGWKNVFWIIVFSIAIQPTMSVLSLITAMLFPNNVASVLEATKQDNLFLFITALAVTPAICEEIFFRGVIFSGYRYQSIGKACLMTGLLFGLMHMDGQQFLYTFALGVIFCYMVYRTQSIFASVLSHFTINASQSLMAYFVLQMDTPAATPDIAVNPFLPFIGLSFILLMSLPFVAGSVWFFLKNNPETPIIAAQMEECGYADYHPYPGAKERIIDIPLIVVFTIWILMVIVLPLFISFLSAMMNL